MTRSNDLVPTSQIPIVFACSGCSELAKIGHDIAITLDTQGLAEMICTSGVGGNIEPLVKKAKSGRKVIAIDGCPDDCVVHCLGDKGIKIDHHISLKEFIHPIRKGKIGIADSARLMHMVYEELGFSQTQPRTVC